MAQDHSKSLHSGPKAQEDVYELYATRTHTHTHTRTQAHTFNHLHTEAHVLSMILSLRRQSEMIISTVATR